MEDKSLYKNLLNENYTDVRKSELIQKVFENKTKAVLAKNSPVFKFNDGGGVDDEQKTYTPYEFLYELLPKVYGGRPYVVTDEVGLEYDLKNEKEQIELDEYIASKLLEYGVNSIYKTDNKTFIEEVEVRRRKLISDRSFITISELHAYLFCHPELNVEHYVDKLPNYDKDSMISNNLIMIDYDKSNASFNYVYVHEYLSGNVYEKLSRLKQYKENLMELGVLSEEQFLKQEKALTKSYPKQAKVTKNIDDCIFILPSSKFGESFIINPNDVLDYPMSYSDTFANVFINWTKNEMDKALLIETNDINKVHHYFTKLSKKGTEPYKYESDEEYSDNREKAFNDGKVALLEFLNKGLTTNCQMRLEIMWNEQYNNYAEPKYYKIPVSCHLSNKFKNNKPFTPNETQVQSMQFIKSAGSGLLAYGVGVGKTASAIMNISYSLDNNICKKPLIVVPNATYKKWEKEMFGGMDEVYIVSYNENGEQTESSFDTERKAKKFAKLVNGVMSIRQEKIYGHISHVKNYVSLYNLSNEVLERIKDYSEDDLSRMKNISDLLVYARKLDVNYMFDDNDINAYILRIEPNFDSFSLLVRYNEIIDSEFEKWYNKDANKAIIREAIGGDNNIILYSEAKNYYRVNISKTKAVDLFIDDLRTLIYTMPYTLGTLKPFEDGTVFMITYEGLKHLGLLLSNNGRQLSDSNSILSDVYRELSQGDELYMAKFGKSNLPSMLKDAIYGSKEDKLDITAFGFDYAIFDESHIMKKAIVDCKGLPTYEERGNQGVYNRRTRKYGFGANDKPSANALIGYFISRYIQNQNNQKNVIHLTATPFTNKPAEIYSMLSLVNRNMLLKNGFEYMEQFFDVYMDISFELAFTAQGVERIETLLGYRNLPQLRNLIYSIMDYKSGEDANIKRPEKILFPSVEKGIETTIPETPQQDALFRQIKDYIRGKINYDELCADSVAIIDVDEMTEEDMLTYLNNNGTEAQIEKFNELEQPLDEDSFNELKDIVKKLSDKKGQDTNVEENIKDERDRNKFRVIQGLGLLKSVTLSPYLSTCQKEASVEPTYDQYVESSPKIMYSIQCINSIHNYELENNLRKSGCVIYMDLGVNVSYSYKNADGETVTFKWKESGFQKIKQYLINRFGYSEDEVVIASGGISPEDKERAKNKFLSGQATVLIGSRTISTGVDLQDNASALFLCAYDWNPTDNEQISGRIHRQGNRFEQIRIVYPMVMNSADPNIFQQLYEKTLRIKNIWDKNDTGNTLDLKDFDVDSLRKGIMDEPEDLAQYWKLSSTKELQIRDNILKARLNSLRTTREDKDTLDALTPVVKGMVVVLDAFKKDKAKKEAQEKLNEKLGDAQEEYDDTIAELKRKLDEDDDFADNYKKEVKKAKEKLDKEKEKLGEDVYDFEKDPDGRYRYLTYDELDDNDELFKKVSSLITNTGSFFEKLSKSEKVFIWNGGDYEKPFKELYDDNGNRIGWLQKNFPRFHEGYWDLSKPQDEDSYNYVDFDSTKPVILANQWKQAYRGFDKMKDYLLSLGIVLNEIPQAIDEINAQRTQIATELSEIDGQYESKLREFTLAKEERLVIQPTIEQRVIEFSDYNNILHKVVPTFAEDRALTYVTIPYEEIEQKPKKKEKTIKEKIEKAVIEEETVQVDTSNLIDNLKNGLVVRFVMKTIKKNTQKVVDIFYEDGDFIQYMVLEDVSGDIINEKEKTITEQQAIDFYVNNNESILQEFYDDGVEEVVEEEIEEQDEDGDIKIKDWYIQNYPTDDLGEQMNDVNTFEDLWNGIHNGINVYDIMGVGDSVVRERLFEHLSEIKGVDYDYVYNKWLGQVEEEEEIEQEVEELEEVEQEEVQVEKPVKTKSKAEMYRALISAYKIGLEIESDENKIKMYENVIRGYELGLELED